MKLNFSETLKGLDGEALKEGEKEIDLRTICVNALLASHAGPDGRPEQPSGVEKIKRYLLAKKLNSGGEQTVTAEEISLLKQMIEKSFATLVVGITNEMLEK